MNAALGRMEQMARTVCWQMIVVGCICLLIARTSAASSPVDAVKTGTEKVLHILKTQSAKRQEKRESIRKVVNDYIGFDEMGRRALGPYWKNLSPQNQREYVQAFSEFLFNVYIDKIEKYSNERLEYRLKSSSGSSSVVEVLITGGRGDRLVVDYHLQLVNGGWKVFDAVIEGVDLVHNYRAQFDSILSKGSFDNLLRLLKSRNAQRG